MQFRVAPPHIRCGAWGRLGRQRAGADSCPQLSLNRGFNCSGTFLSSPLNAPFHAVKSLHEPSRPCSLAAAGCIRHVGVRLAFANTLATEPRRE